MLTTSLKWISAGAFLGSLYWCPDRYRAALLFATWTVAIAGFVYLDLPARFLWVPVALGLAGVFGAIIVLTLPANITLSVNLATFILFLAAIDVLQRRRPPLAAIKHHPR